MRLYLEINALLAIALVLFVGAARLLPSSRQRLKLAQLLFAAAILLPLAASWLPRETLLRPAVQVWSGTPRSAPYTLFAPVTSSADAPVGLTLRAPHQKFLLLAFALGLAFQLALLARAWLRLTRALRALPTLKRIGRTTIKAADSAFAAWLPGRAFVALPTNALTTPALRRIALRHELQHHRQGDPRWAHALAVAKAALFWNPAAHAWAAAFTRLQEFACDEALIGHRGISPQEYGRSLLQAAESAVGTRSAALVGTTGMAASASGQLLKRRIEMILDSTKKRPRSLLVAALVATGTLSLLATAAFASRSAVQDRALTLTEAARLAGSATGEIPVTVNDLVLARLNRFIGTPEGRRFVKEGLARMPMYRGLIERKIEQYGLPADLLAIALFESGFRANAVSPPPYRAAGIWQFIAATARNYGLHVDEEGAPEARLDERLDAEKETDAAMRYFRNLFLDFQDWRLALKAYNEGEHHVHELIERHGTRDPWELERLDTTEGYLSGAIAMILIVRNPSLID